MINLNPYDNADENSNGRIWLRNKKLYTKAIIFRKHYYLLKRYDTSTEKYIYYILISDEELTDREFVIHDTEKNRYGTVIISLFHIWNELNINFVEENVYVNIKLEDKDDVSEIYKLTILG